MDEWISAGDAAFVDKIRRRLDEFTNRAGILVLASHNLDLLERVCTKGVLIEAGRVLAIGPIEEVLTQYKLAIGPGTGPALPPPDPECAPAKPVSIPRANRRLFRAEPIRVPRTAGSLTKLRRLPRISS